MVRVRILAAGLTALLAAGALAGCTTASGGSTAAGGAALSAHGYSGIDSGSSDGVQPASAASGAARTADRSVMTTGTLRLVAARPAEVAGRITDLTTGVGGTVATSTARPSGDGSATLTLRIPAAVFPATLERIEREGRVRDVSVKSSDVTATVTDYGVRIANLRASIARLQTLLGKATTSSALVELEGALTDRQGSLEQLLAQQRDLADRVSLSTLDVTVSAPATVAAGAPADFGAGLATGVTSLGSTAAALAVALGVALPWLVVLGAIGGVVVLVRRRLRRRSAAA